MSNVQAWLAGLDHVARELGDLYNEAVAVCARARCTHAFGPAQQWARALSAKQADCLLQMTLAALDMAEDGMRSLLRRPRPDSEAWRRAAVGLAERRDAIADVALILGFRGKAESLGPSLLALDRDGERLAAIRSLPEADESARLYHAASRGPHAWWAKLTP